MVALGPFPFASHALQACTPTARCRAGLGPHRGAGAAGVYGAGGSGPEGELPGGVAALPASRAEARPRCSGLPVGAAGVCGGSFDRRALPGEGHLPTGAGSAEHPLAWSRFPRYGSALKLLDSFCKYLTLVCWRAGTLAPKPFGFILKQWGRFDKSGLFCYLKPGFPRTENWLIPVPSQRAGALGMSPCQVASR